MAWCKGLRDAAQIGVATKDTENTSKKTFVSSFVTFVFFVANPFSS